MKKFNVAIDGPANSGKTTIGKLLSQKLNYFFFDSGLLYRHFAKFCHLNVKSHLGFSLSLIDLDKLLKLWKKLLIDKSSKVIDYLESESEILNYLVVTESTYRLSLFPQLREFITKFLRKTVSEKGWVVVGRDITSMVLPSAEVKIFLTANLIERVKRNRSQISNFLSQKQTKEKLNKRDKLDRERIISPLKKTFDSWKLDTTFLTLEETLNECLIYIYNKGLLSNNFINYET